MSLMYGSGWGGLLQSWRQGRGLWWPQLGPSSFTGPLPCPTSSLRVPLGGQQWAGDRRPRVGSLPQGLSRILSRLWQCPGAREEPPPPTPLGPSVIRAIFRPLFLPISGLWTGPESGLSWGRGLEPLNWALAWELQPQCRPQRGRSPGGGGEPGRGQAQGRARWGRILAPLTPPQAPHCSSPHWPISFSPVAPSPADWRQ